ncbi:hypothetical protein QJQ45_023548 [Haematococcus lacustris]|nr:hypothetical protein QJQ45_023548 [Haematococcus lacustris]
MGNRGAPRGAAVTGRLNADTHGAFPTEQQGDARDFRIVELCWSHGLPCDIYTAASDAGTAKIAGAGQQSSESAPSDVRRSVLRVAALLAASTTLDSQPGQALPLAPLGEVRRVGGAKLTGLSAEQVKEVLARDLAEGMYFVTGNLTREVFSDDCVFVDPTNEVTGLSKYLTALGILFDPQWSKVELLDIRVAGSDRVEADWRLGGWLRSENFPWQPKVEPFQGHTVYLLDKEGLVSKQEQTWGISALQALAQTFTPVPGPKRQLF